MKVILCCVVIFIVFMLSVRFLLLLQPDDYALLKVDSRLKNSQLSLVSFPLKTIILYEFEGKNSAQMFSVYRTSVFGGFLRHISNSQSSNHSQ